MESQSVGSVVGNIFSALAVRAMCAPEERTAKREEKKEELPTCRDISRDVLERARVLVMPKLEN